MYFGIESMVLAVERDECHQVVMCRASSCASGAHALTFQLKYAHALAPRRHLKGRCVVELDRLRIELDPAPLRRAFGLGDNRSKS